MSEPAGTLGELPPARRIAIADVLREIVATEHQLGALYARFSARSTLGPLKAALAELAEVKATRVKALEPLARALAAIPAGPAAGPRDEEDTATDRAAEFSRAFQGERVIEVGFRELAALGASTLLPRLPVLAAEAARDRARLRELYLRYS